MARVTARTICYAIVHLLFAWFTRAILRWIESERWYAGLFYHSSKKGCYMRSQHGLHVLLLQRRCLALPGCVPAELKQRPLQKGHGYDCNETVTEWCGHGSGAHRWKEELRQLLVFLSSSPDNSSFAERLVTQGRKQQTGNPVVT